MERKLAHHFRERTSKQSGVLHVSKLPDFFISFNSLPREKYVNKLDCGCSHLNSGWYLNRSGGNLGLSA